MDGLSGHAHGGLHTTTCKCPSRRSCRRFDPDRAVSAYRERVTGEGRSQAAAVRTKMVMFINSPPPTWNGSFVFTVAQVLVWVGCSAVFREVLGLPARPAQCGSRWSR